MDAQNFKSLVKNVDTQLFELISNLICSICQELFIEPVTTPCGHSFCKTCIKRVLSSKDNSGCPLCKSSVKRYCLETNKVKLTLSEICKELPTAFQNDVKELSIEMKEVEGDLMRTSKLAQLCNQECSKGLKINKQKTTNKKSEEKNENESGTFVPVLKRSKRVLEYASAKKKRLDDLVSISQTDPASNSSLCGSSDLEKKLEKMDKIPPEEKVAEWFNAVGDNIYINSPTSSIVELPRGKSEEKRSMIRVDYKKNDPFSGTNVDPYEFIPSQNKSFKRKRQKRGTKKIPDFKALQSFTKESLKRSSILQKEINEKVEEGVVKQEDRGSPPRRNLATASQKFDLLLLETKEEDKRSTPVAHVLYSASQASSPKFLDCSFQSNTGAEKTKEKKEGLESLKEDSVLFLKSKVGLFTDRTASSGERSSTRSKRRRSLDLLRSGKKKKLFYEATPVKVSNSVERQTKLVQLLKELVDDEVIYSDRPRNVGSSLQDTDERYVTQSVELIGFCTQEECLEEKKFKQMVENMEMELNSNELSLLEALPFPELKTTPRAILTKEHPGSLLKKSPKEPEPAERRKPPRGGNLIAFNLVGRINKRKATHVDFLYLGRLTPILERSRSSVVNMVFPAGLSSLVKKRQSKVTVGVQTSRDLEVSYVSAGIQTSQQTATVTVQTSQMVQITPEEKSAQKETVSAGIQTTPVEVECAQVQTSQEPLEGETLLRKPINKHRKVFRRENSPVHLLFSEEDRSSPKDLIASLDVEKEFKRTWMKNTQKRHKDLVELKNKKNKEPGENLLENLDEESDNSEVQPPKTTANSRRILSEDSVDVIEKYETRQMIPLNLRKVNRDEEMEVIDLGTPKSQNSEEQMLRVLKNIDLDLVKCRKKGEVEEKGEKSEESDSDFFVEQTPPRPPTESRTFSRPRRATPKGEDEEKRKRREGNSEGTDLIEDSLPKGFSESFLLLSAPQKILSTPEKLKSQRKVQFPEKKPNENDQNELNARRGGSEEKATKQKAVAETWTRPEASKRRFCVVASSVKNPETVKKFASRFKMEYSTKPTKSMTHLIVGLHENDDGELLPLCTPKLLFAIANRKWVVSELWAETSLKLEAILPEESFETPDPVGGSGCRTARLSSRSLLADCEVYLLGSFQTISKEDFADLIRDCGGTLVPGPDKFSFLPGKLRMMIADRDCISMDEEQLQDLHERHSTVILSRDAIIMSIQSYKLANFTPYILHLASEERLLGLGYPAALVRSEEEDDEGEGGWIPT